MYQQKLKSTRVININKSAIFKIVIFVKNIITFNKSNIN